MDVLMPQLGETVSSGKITSWFKKVGDKVRPGEDLFLEDETGGLHIRCRQSAARSIGISRSILRSLEACLEFREQRIVPGKHVVDFGHRNGTTIAATLKAARA